jgi:hypothetical protein
MSMPGPSSAAPIPRSLEYARPQHFEGPPGSTEVQVFPYAAKELKGYLWSLTALYLVFWMMSAVTITFGVLIADGGAAEKILWGAGSTMVLLVVHGVPLALYYRKITRNWPAARLVVAREGLMHHHPWGQTNIIAAERVIAVGEARSDFRIRTRGFRMLRISKKLVDADRLRTRLAAQWTITPASFWW